MTAKIHAEKRQAKGNEEMERILLEQAEKLLLSETGKITDTEEIPLWDAAGRVLSENISATLDQPPFPRSPLDGYAVRSGDIAGVSSENPAFLRVIDEVTAGHWCDKAVTPGTAVRIMTGAMIPEGADCVVKQEDTDYVRIADPDQDRKTIKIYNNVGPGENYCPKGEDFSAGELLAEAGLLVDSYLLAAVTSAGVRDITVYRRLRAAVITTGDELQNADTSLEPGKIYDANGIWLCARLREMGCEILQYETAGDDRDKIADKISEVLKEADLILTTGGVSVGDKDLVPDVIESLNGRVLFHGIRVKPGMPTMLSVVEDIPVLSLSGNPFAVAALFELLVGGYLADRAEEVYIQKKETKVLRQTFVKTGKPKRIVKGKCDEEGVFLPQIQRNGQLKNGIGSNCLVVFPEGERTYPEGEKVQVIRI